MTDDMQNLRNDIAYLKALADGGRNGTHTGGAILIAAGLLYGAASLTQYLAVENLIPLGPATASLGWIVASLIFMAVLVAVKLRWKAEQSAPGSAGLAWKGIGMACFFIFAAIFVATWRTQSPLFFAFSPCIIFVLYGAAWMVAASASHKLWLHLTAWGSFVAALISAWFVGNPVEYLLYTVGLLLLTFLPGVVFTLQAREAR